MSEYFIHKSFFKQNPLDKVSAAIIADYSLTTTFIDELNAEMEKIFCFISLMTSKPLLFAVAEGTSRTTANA